MAVKDHVVLDNPTNNFATFLADYGIHHPALSYGNTKITINSGNTHQHNVGTLTFAQGKLYYFELATPTQSADSQNFGIIGITKQLAGEYTGYSQNRSLFQNIHYPKICFECRSGFVADQTTIQDWGSSSFGGDQNLALSYFTSDSDKFIHDDTPDVSQANTLANAAAGTPSGTGYIPSWTHSGNKIFGILLNFTATDYGSISFTVDGTNWSTPFTKIKLNTGISWTFGAGGYAGDEWRINCGQDPTFGGLVSSTGNAAANGIGSFYYNISSTNAIALCTQNMPTPNTDSAAGNKPEDYFKAVAYAGSIGTNALVDCGFPADLIWIKGRTAPFNTVPLLYDTVRGRTSVLQSSNTDAQYDYSSTGSGDMAPVISTTSSSINGFKTPGGLSGTLINNNINNSSCTYVAWFWQAAGIPNGATSATGSAKRINTSGTQDDTSCDAIATAASATITPTLMSINQQVGFSIVSYTSNPNSSSGSTDTLPHGLTSAPEMIIIKQLNNVSDWMVWHKDVTNTNYNLNLNNTSAEFSVSAGGIRTPNASAIDLGGSLAVNSSWTNTAQLYICYAWHSVAGYSAFGSYIGNGSSSGDGIFVYTGFKPAFVMIKRNATESWVIADNARDPYNPITKYLLADDSNTEGGGISYNFYSNGFKSKTNSQNEAGATYIYMAFAEQPGKYSNGR